MLIRYFAAASAATGIEEETLELERELTLGQLESLLGERHPGDAGSANRSTAGSGGPSGRIGGRRALSDVLTRCSFLRNGAATTDRSTVLAPTDSIDVLPPFAGG
ncbi:MoaD/ThiS family protein [Naasia lichenicola]|nr:MoaD/ThiS family protein [Naasia lichenicola]